MINLRNVKGFCKEFENIENYQEAASSPEKYDCHHRLEETGLSKKDLIYRNMYYNRPANELIFLTHKDHVSLHHKGKITLCKGENHYLYKFICPIKLTYMYCKQGKSIEQIAKELMVGKNTITSRLRKFNIKKSK